MAVVTWQLGKASLVDWPTLAIFALSLILLLRLKVNSAWLIVGAGIVGALLR
jgi:chromate transporter